MKSSSRQFSIAVSGAAEVFHHAADAKEIGLELGREIARQGAVLVVGIEQGFPLWALQGAKEEGGTTIGFSPAANQDEHVKAYRLPMDDVDFVVYTGFGITGANVIMSRSADASIFGAGRMGTVQEFTIAFQELKPIGVLEGTWQTDAMLRDILKQDNRSPKVLVFDERPKELVAALLASLRK